MILDMGSERVDWDEEVYLVFSRLLGFLWLVANKEIDTAQRCFSVPYLGSCCSARLGLTRREERCRCKRKLEAALIVFEENKWIIWRPTEGWMRLIAAAALKTVVEKMRNPSKTKHSNDELLFHQEPPCGIGPRLMPGTRTPRTFPRTCGRLSGWVSQPSFSTQLPVRERTFSAMVAAIIAGQHMEGCPPLHSCILHHLLQPQVGFHHLLPHSPHFIVLSYGFGDEEDGAWSYNRGEFENVVNYFKDNISLLSRVSPSLASSWPREMGYLGPIKSVFSSDTDRWLRGRT